MALARRAGFRKAKRTGWMQPGGERVSDVSGLPWSCEVKRGEALNVNAALADAEARVFRDHGQLGQVFVAHRRNRGRWCATMDLAEFLELLAKLQGQK